MLHSDFERTKNIGIIRPAMIFTSRYQNPAIDEELPDPTEPTVKNKGLPTTKKTSATPLFDAVE